MLRHKNIDRLCCIVLALAVLMSGLFVGAAASGLITADTSMGYETRLFDQSRVHTIDIVIQDWEAFLDTCTSEEYSACHLVIDGESYKNVAIRGKGNTSLSNVASYGNDRYSFKVEFDHYQTGNTYYGLDKLSLNNLIQDNTYMKDYFAYTLMGKMGVAAPLCSFVQINVNGEPWGLYLAVEGVEDAFLQRNYGKNYGELYKPDSLSFGGGRGNGRDFDMEEVAEKFGFSFTTDENGVTTFTMPDGTDMENIPAMPENFDPSAMMGGFGGSFGGQAATAEPTVTATPEPTATPAADGSSGSSGAPAMPTGGEMPDMSNMPTMPTDGTMPDMGNMATMPTGGEMPDMGSMATMPTGGEMPDMGNMATMPTDGAMPDMSQMGNMKMPDMGNMGGGFGMGSDDVKLQYSDDDPSSYSNIFNNAKTDITEADQARLIASLKALGEGDTSVVDTDAVIRYMAVHNFLCNDDSYTGTMVHNYYLYEEDGVLAMIPWDYNLAYGTMTGSDATSTVNTDIDTLVNGGSSDRPMAAWITASEETLAQYHAMYQEFITTVFDSGWFAEEIDRVTAMIAPYVESDPTAFCTCEEFQTGAETLKSFCLKRAESIAAQLKGENAYVDASDITLSAMGTMSGMGGGFGGKSDMSGNRGDMKNREGTSDSKGRDRTQTAVSDAEPTDAVPEMPAASIDPMGGAPAGQAMTETTAMPTENMDSMGASAGQTMTEATAMPTENMGSMGAPAGQGTAEATAMPTENMGSLGASSGQAAAETTAAPTTAAPTESAAPETSTEPDAKDSHDRHSFDGSFDMSGMTTKSSSNDGWVWVAACAALLCAALLFAGLYRNRR